MRAAAWFLLLLLQHEEVWDMCREGKSGSEIGAHVTGKKKETTPVCI
jgi:hypothetical protein